MELIYDDSNPKYCYMRINGSLNSSAAESLEQAIEEICRDKPNNLVLDLGGCDLLASGGLRVLLTMAKKVMAAKKKMVLCHLSDSLKQVFQLSAMGKLFQIVDDLDSATQLITQTNAQMIDR